VKPAAASSQPGRPRMRPSPRGEAACSLRQYFLPRPARGRDRRHDAPCDTMPGARPVAGSRLGWKTGGGVAPEIFILGRGDRYADSADPFSDTDRGFCHGGWRSLQLPLQARLSRRRYADARHESIGNLIRHQKRACGRSRYATASRRVRPLRRARRWLRPRACVPVVRSKCGHAAGSAKDCG
jgi:hypothetical protein